MIGDTSDGEETGYNQMASKADMKRLDRFHRLVPSGPIIKCYLALRVKLCAVYSCGNFKVH
jgi:hypothetical protein